MDAKLRDLSLPEWAFLDDNRPAGGKLEYRTVILHVRSATVLEVFHGDSFVLNEGVLFEKYTFKNHFNLTEEITIAVHYCATLDIQADRRLIVDEIVNGCASWYINYVGKLDADIIKGEMSKLN